VASGLPADAFLFLGYLPRKSGERRQGLASVLALPYTLVFLEAPHRLLSSLGDLLEILGDRQIAVACELTKLYEDIFRGSLAEARAYFEAQAPRGEFTLVVAGHSGETVLWPEDRLRNAIQTGLDAREAPTALARRLADQSGWPRREIYTMINTARE